MEKPQVTFAVTASGLTGPVGSPILVVSSVLERDARELVILRGIWGEMSQVLRIPVRHVPLTAYDVDILAACAEGETRAALIPAFGVQLTVDLEIPSS